LAILLLKYTMARRRPEMEFVVEIVILGAALHLASTMFWSAIDFCKVDTNRALGQFLGFVVIGLSSVIGVWKIINSVHPRYNPSERDEKGTG
jgi:hypothetical protein